MPAGSSCILFVSGPHRHSIWGPDVNEFRPERWLDANAFGDPKSAIYRAFAAFGIGRRLCLGKTYSVMSLKIAICHLLRRYVIMSDISKLELKVDPLLKAISGHEITLEYRK
ncbi:cytochrome P450 94C1-like [Manduca sexta]|uniref:cytochrome P450 94C1-like n=1 Tax=Manduca sexta TaxID=7130 RepID=UPI00188E8129|nr:cytochrome P450 94C1-like [Manduca sexta]